ncbi:hypothetical protein IFM89_010685 [Coptis chinensis]|uniref:Uncharacterized protein n=1 Tax=Coptis chinensis TaxID=261450 RepID=A0A835HBU3_9MAGN|nr:hypothetical protein IFM89_010685 [Coptis chinensis]
MAYTTSVLTFTSSLKSSSYLTCPLICIETFTRVLRTCTFRLGRGRHNNLTLKHVCKASVEGAPSEVLEDSKFVPLNADDPQYGPPALLLLGFGLEETTKIIHCTEDMITRSLWEAMHTQQSELDIEKIAKSPPRICFLSGLTGEEMMMFIDAFPETGKEYTPFYSLISTYNMINCKRVRLNIDTSKWILESLRVSLF